MRRRVILVVLTVFSLLLSIATGCGTLDMDLHTTVKTSGDIIQEIRFEGSGLMATVLEDTDFTEEFVFGEEGWEFDIERTDDSVVVTATGNFILDEDGNISQVEGGPDWLKEFSVRVEDGLLSKKYFAEFNAAGSGDELIGEGGEFDELAGMMLEGMFDISWKITLPGKIVESNADFIEGSSATWDFDIDSLTSGRYLMLHSQYTNWPVIGGIIAGVVLVLALVVFFFIRRRRPSASFSSEVAD